MKEARGTKAQIRNTGLFYLASREIYSRGHANHVLGLAVCALERVDSVKPMELPWFQLAARFKLSCQAKIVEIDRTLAQARQPLVPGGALGSEDV